MSDKKKVGNTGETIASEFLKKQGFEIWERNYNKKWGELDIVAERKRKVHFVEVKTVSCEIVNDNVSHETSGHSPYEKVDSRKTQRMRRAIQTYFIERGLDWEKTSWQVDVLAVFFDRNNKKAKVERVENVII